MCKLVHLLLFAAVFTTLCLQKASMMITTDGEQADSITTSKECKCKTSYLWKVEAEPPVYLYGTLHVPYTKMWNRIPNNQKIAFSSSGSLMVELELTDPETAKKLSNCQFLPEGETLREILPIDLYQRIQKYLEKMRDFFLVWLKKNLKGSLSAFSLETIRDQAYRDITRNWERRRPIWLMYLLDSINEDLLRYYKTPVFDTFLDNAADGMNIQTEAIENVVEHCRPLNNLREDKVILALRKQMDHLEPLAEQENGPSSPQDDYVKTYFCGDFENLVQTTEILPLPSVSNITNITTSEAKTITGMNTYLRKQIVFRRNRRMVKYLEGLMKDSGRNQTSFFAVGAGHFLGRKGVVDLLKKRNYTVTRISLEQHVDGPGLPKDIIALGDPSTVHKIIKIPKEIATSPPSTATLPPLSPEELAKIFKDVLNSSKTFQGGSEEVTPSTAVPEPSSSPIPPTTQTSQSSQQHHIHTRSGIILTIHHGSSDETTQQTIPESNSASSIIGGLSSLTIVSLLAFLSVLFSSQWL